MRHWLDAGSKVVRHALGVWGAIWGATIVAVVGAGWSIYGNYAGFIAGLQSFISWPYAIVLMVAGVLVALVISLTIAVMVVVREVSLQATEAKARDADFVSRLAPIQDAASVFKATGLGQTELLSQLARLHTSIQTLGDAIYCRELLDRCERAQAEEDLTFSAIGLEGRGPMARTDYEYKAFTRAVMKCEVFLTRPFVSLFDEAHMVSEVHRPVAPQETDEYPAVPGEANLPDAAARTQYRTFLVRRERGRRSIEELRVRLQNRWEASRASVLNARN